MKTTIEVKNREEKAAIDAAMADATIRAFVVVSGTLLQLPSKAARARVLNHVYGMVHDPDYKIEERTLDKVAADRAAGEVIDDLEFVGRKPS